MKNILSILFSFYFLLSSFYLHAQVPQKFNYQGIARDAKGNPMAKQQLALKLSVLPTSDATAPEYEEIQHVLTNEFGLYTLQIGNGTALTGEMKTVKWETGNKYIKVMIDPKGGNEFVDAGTTQLLSVPYAIYADKAGMAKNTNVDRTGTVSSNATHVVGDANFLTKFTGLNVIGKSQVFDNGTNVGIGITTPLFKLHIQKPTGNADILVRTLDSLGAASLRLRNSAGAELGINKFGPNATGNFMGIPRANMAAVNNFTTGPFVFNSGSDIVFGNTVGPTQVPRMFVSGATGNVGIGTLTPGAKLEVAGQLKITGGNPAVGKILTSDSNGLASWQTPGTDSQWAQNGNHIFNNNPGNVGIGTNTPSSKLHLASQFAEIRLQNTAINTSLFITAPFNGGTGGIGTDGNHELPFFTNNIERLVIKNDGKVGIGTNTPTSPLHLASPVSEIRLHNTAINASLFITAPFNGGTGGIGTNGNYELPFYTNSIERVVIKNDGKVGVGTSSPTAKLDVNGQVKIAGGNPGAGKVLTSDTNGLASWELQPISWNIDGNANTNQANHFIGTLDAQSLNFRVNNKLSGRIDSSQASSFFGFRAGGNSISNSNSAFGYKSLFSNVTGNQNVAFGVEALFMNVSGGSNVAVGNASLKNIVSGVSNTAIGNNALYELKSGGYNTALGFEALHSDTLSYYNTAIGSLSISNNIHGVSNTAIGHSSLINNSTGSSNVAVGVSALSGNISGSSNTAIGENSFINGGFFNNSTALGAFANITASNQVRIGNASVSSIGGQVGWSTLSDLRLKNNINPIKLGLNFILDLNPVTYSYISDNNNTIYSGFLAQEVEAAAQQHGVKFSGVDAPKNENDFYSLRYAEFTVPLVKSVQELNGEIDLLKKQNQSLQQQIDELKALIKK